MDAAELKDLRIELGDGIVMRTVRSGDAEAAFEVIERNYNHLRTFMEWAKPDYALQDAEEWVAKTTSRTRDDEPLNFVQFSGGQMIGTIGFSGFDIDAKVTEIGYWIDSAEQGKGIMSLATEKLLQIAFDQLGMDRVQIRCADANVRSAAIPRKLGFTEEGRQRKHVMRDGKLYDFLIFGLLRDEWAARTGSSSSF